jgi:Holliday junction resolvase RusA-like endonuclease
MRTISFRCDFRAISKQRARTGKGFAFTPAKTKAFEKAVGFAANAEMAGQLPISTPCRMEIYALFEPPKSWPKWRKEAAYGKPFVSASDADNMIKAIADGLNDITYLDDKQLAHVAMERFYAKQSSFRVTIFELQAVPATRAEAA